MFAGCCAVVLGLCNLLLEGAGMLLQRLLHQHTNVNVLCQVFAAASLHELLLSTLSVCEHLLSAVWPQIVIIMSVSTCSLFRFRIVLHSLRSPRVLLCPACTPVSNLSYLVLQYQLDCSDCAQGQCSGLG